MSQPMEIAMSFIVEADRYFFEHRLGDRANGALGKIGCWGGQLQIKPDTGAKETPLEAVYREVTKEEVEGLDEFLPQNFTPLTFEDNPIEVDSDRDGKPVKIRAHLFQLLLPFGYGDKLRAPNSVWMRFYKLQGALDSGRFSPATEAAVIEHLDLDKTEDN